MAHEFQGPPMSTRVPAIRSPLICELPGESSKASWKARTLAPSSWICYGELNEFRHFVHFNVQLTKFMAFHGNSTRVMMIIMPNLLGWRCWSAMNWEVQQHPCSVEAHRVLCPFDAVPAAVQGLCRGCAGACGAVLHRQTLHLLSQHRSGILALLAFQCVTRSFYSYYFWLISVCCVDGCMISVEIAQRLDMTSIQGQCMLTVLTTIVDRVRGHMCWCFCYIATFH